jgi:hypothetical protein
MYISRKLEVWCLLFAKVTVYEAFVGGSIKSSAVSLQFRQGFSSIKKAKNISAVAADLQLQF